MAYGPPEPVMQQAYDAAEEAAPWGLHDCVNAAVRTLYDPALGLDCSFSGQYVYDWLIAEAQRFAGNGELANTVAGALVGAADRWRNAR